MDEPNQPTSPRSLGKRYLDRLRGASVLPADRDQPLWKRYLTRLIGWPTQQKGQPPH
jgi:hypothetical protein